MHKIVVILIISLVNISGFSQFLPNSIPNLIVWNRADSVNQISNEVSQWYDMSGNGNHTFQATGSRMPNLIANVPELNNRPSLSFNGTSEFLSGAQILGIETSSVTIYVIASGLAQTGTEATLIGFNSTFSASFWMYQRDNSTLTSLVRGNRVGTSLGSLPYTGFNHSILSLNKLFGTSLKLFINDVELLSSTNATQINDFVNGTFFIGSVNTARYFKGKISEILVFNRSLTETENDSIVAYFIDRYTPILDLGADTTVNGFCPMTIDAGEGFTSYVWSDGSTGQSNSVSESGQYWVQVTDIFGFPKSDTINITYPTIPSPVNTGICAGQSNTWNADMGAGFTYLWSNGATSPSITITTPGQYFVKVTDQFGCFKFSDTLDFTLDTYSITANLGADTNLCFGNFIALQSGAGETVSYLWPDGSNGNQYAVDTTGNYYVQSVNVNGCVAQDTVHINVIGIAPLAEFSTANVCDGITANFTDNSVPVGVSPIDAWAWDFGDDSLSTNQSPSHAYSVPGTYIVELFVSQGGCGAFHYDTVTVHENPEALFVFSGYCQNQPVQFNNATIVGDAPLTTYAWNFDMPWTGAYNVSTIPIPYREFDSSGVFDVQLTVTDANGCVDEVIIPVNIDPSPEVTFAISDACVNQTAAIQFTGTTQGPSTYAWDFGDNGSSILMNPTHTYSVYGNYTVSLAVTNQYNCTLTGQNQVEVFATPIPSFDLGPYCKGTYVEMTNTSTIADGSIAQTSWVINATDTVNGNPGFYLIDNLGQQQIEVISTSNEGCSASTFEFIEVEDSLNVSFTVGTGIAAVGEPFPFTNTTTGTNLALWNFGDQTFSSEFSPVHTYGEAYTDSVVEVYLIGLNAAGCVDTAYQNVTVRPAELDLAIETLFLQENGTFDFLGVKMKNEGTVSVKKVEFDVFSDKGPLFQETWTGNLLPTKDSIYVFLSQPSLNFSTEDDKQAYVCVKSIAYDWQNEAETILDNNDRCLNLEGDGVILTTIAPNPASTEVGFQLLVTKSSTISAELIDMNGKMAKILIPSTTVEPGIVNINADIRQLENGVYFLKFTSNGSTTTQRLVILQ
jgi:PKD repeat protein